MELMDPGRRATQKERLYMIRLTLQAQLGVDAANSHYNVAVESVGVIPITSTRLGVSDPAPIEVEPMVENGVEEDDGGMYL